MLTWKTWGFCHYIKFVWLWFKCNSLENKPVKKCRKFLWQFQFLKPYGFCTSNQWKSRGKKKNMLFGGQSPLLMKHLLKILEVGSCLLNWNIFQQWRMIHDSIKTSWYYVVNSRYLYWMEFINLWMVGWIELAFAPPLTKVYSKS